MGQNRHRGTPLEVPAGLLSTWILVQGYPTLGSWTEGLKANFDTDLSAHLKGDYESLAHRMYFGPFRDKIVLVPWDGANIDELAAISREPDIGSSGKFTTSSPKTEVISEARGEGVDSHLRMAQFLMRNMNFPQDMPGVDLAATSFDLFDPKWRKRARRQIPLTRRFFEHVLAIAAPLLGVCFFAAPTVLVGALAYGMSGWVAALLLPIPTALLTLAWVSESRESGHALPDMGRGVLVVAAVSAFIFLMYVPSPNETPGDSVPPESGADEAAEVICDGIARGLSRDQIVKITVAATGVSTDVAEGAFEAALGTCD